MRINDEFKEGIVKILFFALAMVFFLIWLEIAV